MSSTRKKVIVRKLDRDVTRCRLRSVRSVDRHGKLELLNTAGNVVTIATADIKGVYFVREFGEPESLTRKTFCFSFGPPAPRRTVGAIRLRDNEVMKDSCPTTWSRKVATAFPSSRPIRSNTQRIFGAGSVLSEMNVIAVIGEKKQQRPRGPEDTRQVPMFGDFDERRRRE